MTAVFRSATALRAVVLKCTYTIIAEFSQRAAIISWRDRSPLLGISRILKPSALKSIKPPFPVIVRFILAGQPRGMDFGPTFAAEKLTEHQAARFRMKRCAAG